MVATILLMVPLACAQAEQRKPVDLLTDVAPNTRIDLEGIHGSDIRFHSWSKNQVSIHLNVSISASSEDYEREFISSVRISQSTADGVLRLRLEESNPEDRSSFFQKLLRFNFYVNKNITGEIYVPESNPLTTDMRYGSVSLENMKGSLELLGTSNTLNLRNCSAVRRVENNYGHTTIEDCGGDKMELIGTSSAITIRSFKGNLDLDANYTTITLSQITGNVVVRDQSGKIDLDSAGGNVRLDANYSTIGLGAIRGDLKVTCTSGSIRARSIGGTFAIDAKYSHVDIDEVKNPSRAPLIYISSSSTFSLTDAVGNVQVDNPYGNITLARINGDLDIATTSGTVDLTDITGNLNARMQYTSLSTRNLDAKQVTISNSSNPIDLRLKSVPATIDIKNSYGGVKVRMPSGFSGGVELTAEYGSIETDLPVKMKSLSSSMYALGKVGTGSGSITIETKSANIWVMTGEK